MAVRLVDVEEALVFTFLNNSEVKRRVGNRFYKLACQEWIKTRESLQSESFSRLAFWADYRRLGTDVRRLLNGKESKLRYAAFEVRTWGQTMEDAESLQETFLLVLGEGVATTWAPRPDLSVVVQNAHWLYDTQDSDYDDTTKQAYAGIGLLIPYRSD